LDGIRGTAILLVMIFHMTYGIGGWKQPEPVHFADRFAQSLFSAGWCGVDLFFVLSGFLITGILYDTKSQSAYFKTFYARRALRIFPLYYAVVFVSLILLPAIATHLSASAQAKLARFGTIEGDQWMYWTYLSNFAIAQAGKFRHGILDISWSLAIEEQFYLVWPAIVYFCSRRTLMRVCVGAIVFAVAFRCVLLAMGANAIALHVLTPSRVDGLAIGAFIALCVRSEDGLAKLAAAARIALPFLLALVIGDWAFRFLTRSGREGEEGLFSANLPEVQTVGLTVIGLLFGAILVRAVHASQRELARPEVTRSALVRMFESRLLRLFGKYSYAMYLFHLPIRAVPRDLLFGKALPSVGGLQLPAQLTFAAGCIAATFVAAWLSWNLYEKHWLALKRYFEYR
ncbi:MAG: acyltransferase, partial [Planctomycetes bacterium]|nr:acyltransferase [Planctomycetota bacterium]